MTAQRYVKISSEGIAPERSTCGYRQRILKKADEAPASITRLKTDNATPHWHKITHEYYYILRGEGTLVIDGEAVPVQAGDCVWIQPGAMHHATGDLESLIIGIPPFDPSDLYFDRPEAPAP